MEKHLTIMNKENFYLIKIEKYKDFLLNKKNYQKKFSALKKDYFILDHHITLFEILRIYFFFTKFSFLYF